MSNILPDCRVPGGDFIGNVYIYPTQTTKSLKGGYMKDNCEVCKKPMVEEDDKYRVVNMCESCWCEVDFPYRGVYVGGLEGLDDENGLDSEDYSNRWHIKPEHQLPF